MLWPFLRDVVLLLISMAAPARGQNHHHEGNKEQKGTDSLSLQYEVSGESGPILIAFYDLHRCSGCILGSPTHRGAE